MIIRGPEQSDQSAIEQLFAALLTAGNQHAPTLFVDPAKSCQYTNGSYEHNQTKIFIALASHVGKRLSMDSFHRGKTLFSRHNFLLLYIPHFGGMDSHARCAINSMTSPAFAVPDQSVFLS